MSKRDRWIAHLTSSQHVHRFLSRIGAGSEPSVATGIDPERLKQYLASLPAGEDDAALLLEVMELLTNGYAEFLDSKLPGLLTVLGNRTEHRQEVVGPAVRGVVQWDQTKVRRANRTLPTARYVSNIQVRSYETPENVLLVWLLQDVERAVAAIARRVGSARLHPVLQRLRTKCRDALRNEALSSVESIRTIGQYMIRASLHSRHPGYREAARLVRRRLRMQQKEQGARWQLILELLKINWLEPVSEDDLFELFALSITLDVLSQDLGLGDPVQYGLLGAVSEPAAIYKFADRTIRVFFDRAPNKVLGGSSRYRHVSGTYRGIDGSERRPDILVHADNPVHGSDAIFIEVKNAGTAAYVRSSIYKLFGYVYDYHSIFERDDAVKGVLYLPRGTVTFGGTEESASGIALIVEDERSRFADVLRSALTLEAATGSGGDAVASVP